MPGAPRAASAWRSDAFRRDAWGPAFVQAGDFKRALALRPCARTEHFALHHAPRVADPAAADLSTAASPAAPSAVDEQRRLGLVVPKRLARRAVTRNLVKRQGRRVFSRVQTDLAFGDWLLRLRRAYEPQRFPSAGSPALRQVLSVELETLFSLVRCTPTALADAST